MASRNERVLRGLVVLCLILGLPALSFGTPMVRLVTNAGANQVTITDQGAGPAYPGTGVGTSPDNNGAVGTVGFSGVIGSRIVNTPSGASIGSATNPNLSIGSFNASSSTPGAPAPLVLMFTETGFVGNPSGISFFDSIGGTTQGTVSYQTYYSNTNAAFALTTLIDNPSITLVAGSFSTSAGCCGPFVKNPSNPYSLTQVVTINHPAGTGIASSFSAALNGTPGVVPEPSSLLLLGSGLIWACRHARRKKRVE